MIDYSRTIIYKIQHKIDKSIFYIGNTTCMRARTATHKYHWKKSNSELYEMIRENGGIDCFDISKVKDFPCKDVLDVCLEKENIRHKVEMDAYVSKIHSKS